MANIESTPEFVSNAYAKMNERIEIVRKRLNRPLTLAEKIIYGHLDDPQNQNLERGKSYLNLRPDRIAMQDATAQMALLQFMTSGRDEAAVPTTVHCDHLILGEHGEDSDLPRANEINNEVYNFLRTVSAKYGLGFWKPGSGIIHQVVLEHYAFPGGLMIGTDSHTPNAGGLGMCACGVGGADAVDVMANFPWEVKNPNVIGVKLTGQLNGWASPKDVILKLLDILTVKGGTNAIVEYFGEGVESISCTGKGTICNMGAEHGATCSVFPYDQKMKEYLAATERAELGEIADGNKNLLTADSEVLADPEKYYTRVVEIDLTSLEPHVVGPHTPDLARPVSAFAAEAKEKGYPLNLTAALIGSCTNSSYEDICRATDVAQQAIDAGVKPKTSLFISPGSTQIKETIERDGQFGILKDMGATVLANACGPCIGQWKRNDLGEGTDNSIITSFNRNFPKRNDGLRSTRSFIASPEIVLAYSLTGSLEINPTTDEIVSEDGSKVKLNAPKQAPELPANGFVFDRDGFIGPVEDRKGVTVEVDPNSERLELLTPFKIWSEDAFNDLPILLKAKGKCTTDHISPAGPWLRFRGHLDQISNNMFLGANNAFTGEPGTTVDHQNADAVDSIPKVARGYKAKDLNWVVIGDENYGEGSSREHAAMCPRHLGAAAVLVRSFARIHETNLKKQGVLPLTFANPADYDKIALGDKLSIGGVDSLAPGQNVTVTVNHNDGSSENFEAKHTLGIEQIKWFRAGSALNLLRQS